MSRASSYTVYIFYTILACTSLMLVRFNRTNAYTVPASDDDLSILGHNVSYLFNVVARVDRMLEIIYFGFMFALLFLGYAHRRLQLRVGELEEKVGEMSKVARMDHPAYEAGHGKEKGRESIMDSIYDIEAEQKIDAKRIGELEKRVAELIEERTISAKEKKLLLSRASCIL
jgi:hypothetical protein